MALYFLVWYLHLFYTLTFEFAISKIQIWPIKMLILIMQSLADEDVKAEFHVKAEKDLHI